jgi:hypothetical protein
MRNSEAAIEPNEAELTTEDTESTEDTMAGIRQRAI